MEKIDFCWREYLERDVSLFEEVETADATILMKYVYPDSLLDKLPKNCRSICRNITNKIKLQHGDLYCEEDLAVLYSAGSRTIKFKNVSDFIERSLHRLLISKEKPYNPLFTSGMIRNMKGLFREIVTTPADQTISVEFKKLWRPVGERWRNLSEDAMSGVRDSQAKFLFHYFMSYLRKFVMCVSVGNSIKLHLRPMESVISAFSQENCKDLMFMYVKVPTLAHFNSVANGCLIRKCSYMRPHQLARCIIGPKVFSSLKKESQELLEEPIGVFIEKHRKLSAKLATLEWLSPDKLLLSSIQHLLSKIEGIFYSSIGCLYTRFNLEAAGRELVDRLKIKHIVQKEELFSKISVDFNPEPVPFIDSLSEHLGRRSQKAALDFQQAVFYNSLFFYYFYAIHWIRRVAFFTPSVYKNIGGHQLWWREEADVKRLLDQAKAWAVKGAEIGREDDWDTTDWQEGEDETADWQDDDNASTSHIEEPEIDFPRVVRNTKETGKEASRAEASSSVVLASSRNGGEEAESPERESGEKKKKKREKNRDEEERESQESGEVKKKKRKRKRSHSDHDREGIEVVEPPKDVSTPRAKKKTNSEPVEVVTLSSDDEAELNMHQWEVKWMAQLSRLSADPDVPAMACLTLQTVFENSKRIRLELKNLER